MSSDTPAPHFRMISVLATIAIITMVATIIYAVTYHAQKPSTLLDTPEMDATLTAPAITSTSDLGTAESMLDSVELENNDELDRLEKEINVF